MNHTLSSQIPKSIPNCHQDASTPSLELPDTGQNTAEEAGTGSQIVIMFQCLVGCVDIKRLVVEAVGKKDGWGYIMTRNEVVP